MDNQSFQKLMNELEGLTPPQREALMARVRMLADHDDSQRLIDERFGGQIHCPHCANDRIVKFGKLSGQQRYRCKTCTRTFVALTGTPFLHLRDKEKLLAHADCMANSLTIRKTAANLGLTVDRAFRWRHRFLEFLSQQKPAAMTGIIEADETFFRRSFKGQRKEIPRSPKKRGGPDKDLPATERVPVLVAMQRGTRLAHDCVLDSVDAFSLTAALRPALSKDAVLSSDGNPGYGVAARTLGIEAGYFVSSYHGPGGTESWHVQNVNAYDSRLKTWMVRFKGIATKYLHNYLGWRRFIDRFRDNVTAQQFLFHALRTEYVNL